MKSKILISNDAVKYFTFFTTINITSDRQTEKVI